MQAVIPSHLRNKRYTLLIKDTARLAQLTLLTYERRNVLRSIPWSLPDSSAQLSHMDPEDLVTIYRVFDETMEFPSEDEQNEFTALMLDYIDNVSFNYLSGKQLAERRQGTLEHLLFTKGSSFSLPISDFTLRNHAVAQWVDCIIQQYGLDDGSEEYFNKLLVIVEKLFAHVTGRDITYIMEKLTDGILAQKQISDYIGIRAGT